MIEINGQYNTAIVYTDDLEEYARSQIQTVCDQETFRDSKLRIMPDVHAGMSCTIGTTMTIHDKVVPGMVGVDIGCGMETIRIAERKIDFDKLDALIREQIPFGRDIREKAHPSAEQIELEELKCMPYVGIPRARRSVGTLGGGNHFIELDRGSDGAVYLVIHSGSRHLGKQTAEWYQEEGRKTLCGCAAKDIKDMIDRMKSEGRFKEIESTKKAMMANHTTRSGIPENLAYVEGDLFDMYMHDMNIVQKFAALNRSTMASILLEGMGWTENDRFTTIHNYIDTEQMVLRKGAVSARSGEKLLIPINMRDGSLICIGKGNPDWNESAPHGAGRLMSRKAARAQLSMDTYKTEMEGIYTTCVNPDTLDEAPMAYKGMDEIVKHITPTADIVEVIRPVYNFKATE